MLFLKPELSNKILIHNPISMAQSVLKIHTKAPNLSEKITLSSPEIHNIIDGPISDVSVSSSTKTLAIATTDSRIVLTTLDAIRQKSDSSTVHINLERINKITWLNHYDFGAAGIDGSLHCFSVMSLRCESFHLHSGAVSSMKKRGCFLYTGSSNGTVNLWDTRTEKSFTTIPHLQKSRKQPLKDIEVFDNFLFTSTLYQGRVWAWDLRNTTKCLNTVETKHTQNSLQFVHGNLYSACDQGILKISQDLTMREYFYKQECDTRQSLTYNERYRSLIWTEKNSTAIAKIDGVASIHKVQCDGIVGIERYDTGEILGFSETGNLTVIKVVADSF